MPIRPCALRGAPSIASYAELNSHAEMHRCPAPLASDALSATSHDGSLRMSPCLCALPEQAVAGGSQRPSSLLVRPNPAAAVRPCQIPVRPRAAVADVLPSSLRCAEAPRCPFSHANHRRQRLVCRPAFGNAAPPSALAIAVALSLSAPLQYQLHPSSPGERVGSIEARVVDVAAPAEDIRAERRAGALRAPHPRHSLRRSGPLRTGGVDAVSGTAADASTA